MDGKFDSVKQNKLAESFHELHHGNRTLVLPNAWDAASAKIFENAGFPAVATSSSAIAWSQGYSDGEYTPADTVIDVIQKIARVVNVPVTADVEAGYSDGDDEKFAEFIARVIEAGAVGVNLEDSVPSTGELQEPEYLRKQIDISRSVAKEKGVRLFINARVDGMLLKSGSESEKAKFCIERANLYKQAGADGIFVPFIQEMETVALLKKEIELPLNILMNKFLNVAKLKALKVERISVGGRPMMSLMHSLKGLAEAMKTTNDWSGLYVDDPTYEELNSYFK